MGSTPRTSRRSTKSSRPRTQTTSLLESRI
jgi:hypothetical protein